MRFFSYFAVLLPLCLLSNALALQPAQAKKPQTFITLSAQTGCKVHIAAWLSPSCAHCAEYFINDIPKITAMPGFCLDLHLVPYLYALDRPVSILIISQGPNNILKNADLFFRNQSKWLDISAERTIEKHMAEREEDLAKFLKDIKKDPSKNFKRIKNYLVANDEYLYVKMFALNFFTIDHLEKYLPKENKELINELSIELISNLPKKDNDIVKFSPFFTDLSGQLIPDEKLHGGILTPDVAEDMLKMAGQSIPAPVAPSTYKAERTQNIEEDDKDIQYADEEIETNEPSSEKQKGSSSPYDDKTDYEELDEELQNILEELEINTPVTQ